MQSEKAGDAKDNKDGLPTKYKYTGPPEGARDAERKSLLAGASRTTTDHCGTMGDPGLRGHVPKYYYVLRTSGIHSEPAVDSAANKMLR